MFLLGCEADYLRDMVGGADEDGFCGGPRRQGGDGDGQEAPEEEDERGLETNNSAAAGVSLAVVDRNREAEEREGEGESLVVHIRSGDIFKPDREGWHGMIWYGQVSPFFVSGFSELKANGRGRTPSGVRPESSRSWTAAAKVHFFFFFGFPHRKGKGKAHKMRERTR